MRALVFDTCQRGKVRQKMYVSNVVNSVRILSYTVAVAANTYYSVVNFIRFAIYAVNFSDNTRIIRHAAPRFGRYRYR